MSKRLRVFECLNNPDNFCNVCGEFIKNNHAHTFTPAVQLHYLNYFGISPNITEPWTPKSLCDLCYIILTNWAAGGSFVMPMFFKGRKKILDESDLYRALNEHKSDLLGEKLSKAWEEERHWKEMKHKEPSLVRAILRVFGLRFLTLGSAIFFLEIGLRVTQPLFLGGLVSYYAKSENNTSGDLTTAYLYAIGIILCSGINVLLMHSYMLGMYHLGMKIRVAMCSMIYRKTLRLSKIALGKTTSGQVVNLISNDVGRMDTSMVHMHYLWLGPLEMVIVTHLMYREIGVSSFFGVAIMILFVLLQAFMGKWTSVLRLRTALCTDERVRMMNEIISGIQVIKMYVWEKPFRKMIQCARLKEMNNIRYVNYMRGVLQSFIMFLTRISIFASLVGFVLLGRVLTAETAFVITAYYNILRSTMVIFFPKGLSQFAEMLVSFKRIQEYMMHEETTVPDKSHNIDCGNNKLRPTPIIEQNGKPIGLNGIIRPLNVLDFYPPQHKESGITISRLKAKWNPQSTDYTLDNIDLKIKPRSLVAVIGPVGSGKSSLIQVILGELPSIAGSVSVSGTISYASQEPWLFTGTVRQNILFGMPMDKRRYRTVVKKCALERDFELLPHGDKTIVGDRGASFSGGQKARINLARAVYRKCDVYLLDDPLSAVDTHVGRHLFGHCMRGFLRDNIVLLVTHQLQFMKQADLIVIMDKGRVSAIGTFESMCKSGLDFAKLLMLDDNQEDVHGMRSATSDIFDRHALTRRSSRRASRKYSVSSITSMAESVTGDSPMLVEESRGVGKIGLTLYKKYFGASGNFFLVSLMLLLYIGTQVLSSGGDYFLTYWVKKNRQANSSVADTLRQTDKRLNNDSDSVDLYIFSAIIASTVIFALARSFLFFNLAERSSANIHNTMFQGVARTSMYFFHTNPAGRILNRFSKDLGQVDEILPGVILDVIQICLSLLGIVVVLCVVNPWYLTGIGMLGILFYFMRSFYLNTSRDVKRLEAITRSPIYSHLGATINGLSTIRAFGAQHILISEFDNYQDLNSSGYFMFLSINRAFGYWLDCFCVFYLAFITLSFFLFTPKNGGDVGLAITQALGLTGTVQAVIRQSAELENTMTALERLLEYEDLKPEGDMESPPEKKPPNSWPEEGQIIFDKLSLRYFPDHKSETILKNLNISIKAREKIGIVGRTGAGKSSLINALFRLSYNDGSVIIDNRDTNDMGIYDLRSKISIIPQEPVLFSGTMRYNLDPFDEYSDAKLWETLEEVKLKDVVSELPGGLLSRITEGGANFSVGQRQFICLARAILRENRILVMDEATANVDPQTDALIQTTIRNKFRQCTVLTIAHRLHTVMDSDKVLVMDAGRAVEFDSPYQLLTQSKSHIFHGMVQQMGSATFGSLLNVAQKAYKDSIKAGKYS